MLSDIYLLLIPPSSSYAALPTYIRNNLLFSLLSVFFLLTFLFVIANLVTRSIYHESTPASTQPSKKGGRPKKAPRSNTPVQPRVSPARSKPGSRDTSSTSTSTTTTAFQTNTRSPALISVKEHPSDVQPEPNGVLATLRTMIATTLPRAFQLPLPDLATLSLSSDRVSAAAVAPVAIPSPPNVQVSSTSPLGTDAPLLNLPETPWPVKQPYDAFLVLDVEATCQEGTDFNWPNEIIEWPVCLLRWRNKDRQGRAKELYIADEFRSFVKPTWKPELSAFCTSLTGITQAEVNRAPKFAKVLESFKEFMVRNGLMDRNGEKLQRFAWCTDGPFDIRDFVVKQCFISKIQMPEWLRGDVLDVRKTVNYYLALQEAGASAVAMRQQQRIVFPRPGTPAPKRRSLNISQQLRALSLPAFVGRQHSGIDDTRNIARIVTELGKRGIRLEPNMTIFPGRRWQWMGKPGQILEEYCFN